MRLYKSQHLFFLFCGAVLFVAACGKVDVGFKKNNDDNSTSNAGVALYEERVRMGDRSFATHFFLRTFTNEDPMNANYINVLNQVRSSVFTQFSSFGGSCDLYGDPGGDFSYGSDSAQGTCGYNGNSIYTKSSPIGFSLVTRSGWLVQACMNVMGINQAVDEAIRKALILLNLPNTFWYQTNQIPTSAQVEKVLNLFHPGKDFSTLSGQDVVASFRASATRARELYYSPPSNDVRTAWRDGLLIPLCAAGYWQVQ